MLCIRLFVWLFGSYTSCTELARTCWGGLSRIGLTGPPGTNYAVMKKAFDEGWGAVIAKTVSLDSSKACTATSPRHGANGTQLVEQSCSYIHWLKQLMVTLTRAAWPCASQHPALRKPGHKVVFLLRAMILDFASFCTESKPVFAAQSVLADRQK